jgi:uncharacterized protein YegP (UPF0339 family)
MNCWHAYSEKNFLFYEQCYEKNVYLQRKPTLKQKIMGKFEIKTRKNGEFQFNLKATNGQVILTSEGYKTKASCLNGVESVKKNCQDEKRFEIKEASNGKPYFNLMATNGQIIGSSQMYANTVNMKNGIASVMKNAPDAPIVDLTEA